MYSIDWGVTVRLVEHWQYAWKWASIQIGAAHTAAQTAVVTALALMPEPSRVEFITQHATQWVWFTLIATFVQTFARLIQQQPIGPEAK